MIILSDSLFTIYNILNMTIDDSILENNFLENQGELIILKNLIKLFLGLIVFFFSTLISMDKMTFIKNKMIDSSTNTLIRSLLYFLDTLFYIEGLMNISLKNSSFRENYLESGGLNNLIIFFLNNIIFRIK